jgi:hypothetical protein
MKQNHFAFYTSRFQKTESVRVNKLERERERERGKRGGIEVYHDTFVSGVQREQAHARTEQRPLKVY